MSGPQFFQTAMGSRFYEGTMPLLVRELKALNQGIAVLNKNMERIASALEAGLGGQLPATKPEGEVQG